MKSIKDILGEEALENISKAGEEEKGEKKERFVNGGDSWVTKSGVKMVYTGKKLDGHKVYIVEWLSGNSGYYYKFDEDTLMRVEVNDDGTMYNSYKVGRDGRKIVE